MQKIAIILLALCALAFGQKPKLVFVVDADKKLDAVMYKRFSGYLVRYLDKYVAVDRSAESLIEIRKEFAYQMSGEVREEAAPESKIGRQLEADYLCIISINWSKD